MTLAILKTEEVKAAREKAQALKEVYHAFKEFTEFLEDSISPLAKDVKARPFIDAFCNRIKFLNNDLNKAVEASKNLNKLVKQNWRSFLIERNFDEVEIEIFISLYVDGKSFRQIARKMKMTVDEVKGLHDSSLIKLKAQSKIQILRYSDIKNDKKG